MQQLVRIFPMILAVFLLASCANQGASVAEQRSAINQMANESLQRLYKEKPGSQEMVKAAAGYAVFDSAEVNVILASFGGGYGVAVNKSGKRTYMKMGTAGVGLGAGVKDFKAVFLFRDNETFTKFVEEGWEFGGHADAAAQAGEKGGSAGGKATLDQAITVFQFTETGLALQATVTGTKYWKDDELN